MRDNENQFYKNDLLAEGTSCRSKELSKCPKASLKVRKLSHRPQRFWESKLISSLLSFFLNIDLFFIYIDNFIPFSVFTVISLIPHGAMTFSACHGTKNVCKYQFFKIFVRPGIMTLYLALWETTKINFTRTTCPLRELVVQCTFKGQC